MLLERTADTGFRPEYQQVAVSDLGPYILAAFALIIISQGLIYILRPDMTSRSITASPGQLRRTGFIIILIGCAICYGAFSWWADSMLNLPPVDRPRN